MSSVPPRWNLREWIKMWRRLGRLPMSKTKSAQIQRLYLAMYVRRDFDRENGCVRAGDLVWRYTSSGHVLRLFEEIFLEQTYAFGTDATAPRIMDCGANIGMSLLYFKMCHPNARITAFEPDSKAAACCRKNIDENQLHEIDLHEVAVAASAGSVTFYTDEDNPGALTASTICPRVAASRGHPVEAVRLSEYLDEDIDFLKMDIEGGEAAVLHDLSSSGKLHRIRQMVVEYHHHLRPETDDLSGFLRVLEESGFGYQLQTRYFRRPLSGPRFQDILIYAFRKQNGGSKF